jgi:hypothetical protein
MNLPLIVSGLAVGFMFGYVLQHGRFCMNTAFREVLLSKDFTVFRAYILALLVSIIGANLMDSMGIIHLKVPAFTWVANALGGYIFGMSMVLGGGCASGTLYRIGEGMIGSWFTALGFMLGAAATISGFLRPVAEFFWFGPGADASDPSTYKFAYQLSDAEGNSVPVTIFNIMGVNRWIIIAVLGAAAIIFISKGKFKKPATQKGFTWWSTGIMIGLVSAIAFFASERLGGMPQARGLSFTGPLNELVTWFTGSSTASQFKSLAAENNLDLNANLAAAGTLTWSVWMIGGVVLGSLFSAMQSKEFGWRAPKAKTLATQFGAGLVMGFSGTMAGGCNVGHGLTGLSTLALGSLVGLIFIILGCWTMVYFLFIRE